MDGGSKMRILGSRASRLQQKLEFFERSKFEESSRFGDDF